MENKPERKVIGPSQGDVERGIGNGTSRRVLFQELSEIADRSRDDESVAGKAVKNGLGRLAEIISGRGKKK